MKVMSLKQVLNRMGAQDIQIKNKKISNQSRAEWTGFFTLNGKLYYISTSWHNMRYEGDFKKSVPLVDVNGGLYDGAPAIVMYRTALDRKDFGGRGGINQWNFGEFAIANGAPDNVALNIW